MFIWLIRSLVIIAGPVIGWFQISKDAKGILIGVAAALLVLFIEFIIEKIPLDSIVAGGLGAILGLISAKLLDYTLSLMENENINAFASTYSLLIKLVFAYLGLIIAIRKKDELSLLEKDIQLTSRKIQEDLKILDSSAIIDGRILDIIETNFLSGIAVIPEFIISELQLLADSSDSTKRSRGRRGLNIVEKLRVNSFVPVKIFNKDYPGIKLTDGKVLKLAEELKAKVITTDYNLSKVAVIHNITVMNVNELASVMKPVLLPGEQLTAYLVKEGKEKKQAVAFLEDGSMIVVENGRQYIGKRMEIVITNILQTSTGKMAFATLKEEYLK